MDFLVLLGRILFVSLFLNSAIGHLTQSKALAGYPASKGVPAARASVLASGAMLALGGLSVLLGVWPDLGVLLLLLFLLPTALLMHPFWKESDPGAKETEKLNFLKALSLAGACLMLFALFAFAGEDLGLVWGGPLFDFD